MNLRSAWPIFCAVSIIGQTYAQTEIGGNINIDTTMYAFLSPYIVTTPILVGNGATLTIEPGCEVRVSEGLGIIVGTSTSGPGTLLANGTAENPIVFTSANEEPMPGDWNYIILSLNATDTVLDPVTGEYLSGSIFRHVTVEYAGRGSADTGGITLLQSNVLLDHVTVRDIANHGYYAEPGSDDVHLTITNSSFLRCDSFSNNDPGGGISINNGSGHRLSNITIDDCTSLRHGGGLYLGAAENSVLESISIMNCSTADDGGGAYIIACEDMTISDLSVEGCTAERYAGVRLASCHNATITRASITNNGDDRCEFVAGMSANGNDIVIRDSSIAYNKTGTQSSSSIGGLSIAGTGVQILGCTIEGNEAMNAAGGIEVNGENAVIRDCMFYGNKVTRVPSSGAGALGVYRLNLLVENCLFDSNFSTGIGGAVLADNSTSFINCEFSNNESLSDGGAIYIGGTGNTILGSNFIGNTAIRGGAIFVGTSGRNLTITGDLPTGVYNTFDENAAEEGITIYNDLAFRADGSYDFNLSDNCWGDLRLAQVDGQIFDYFDDPSKSIAVVNRLAPCACPADVNYDGFLTPGDFVAWISAYYTNSGLADQNGDGVVTPADFTAWVANYNAGC